MFSAQEELARLRPELRYLRIKTQTQARANLSLRHKANEQDKIISSLIQENNQLRKEKEKLEQEIDKTRKQRDKYKGMIFKPNIQVANFLSKKKLGGQLNHLGDSRRLPQKVDEIKRVFLHHCPNCGNPLLRTDSLETHTVEDIPDFEEIKTQVTKYECERQWCGSCGKEVVASPSEVIPNSRLGLNLIIQVLVWKYSCRMSFEIIVNNLFQTYGVFVTEGGLVNILKRTKLWLGPEYGKLLAIIRGSPVKHADETSWRIKGLNGWLWAFLTEQSSPLGKDACYLTIEHSRGKGVAEKVLSASNRDDVLIRDDYAGYKNLKMNHQSCWVHLLRVSKEAVLAKGSSKEIRILHKRLKYIYHQLDRITKLPFDKKERSVYYQEFGNKIQEIIQTDYLSEDALKIQVRIKNQGNNLITAILFPNVPLDNNLAERGVRPSVIVRKISGGSRSDEGAETFAVNMSIIQTIRMRNQPLIPTLHDLLLKGVLGNTK